jgi:hypothetical protein
VCGHLVYKDGHSQEGFPLMENVRSNFATGMYFLFKALPAAGGIFAIYLGYKLFILGVTGQASLSIESKSVSGQGSVKDFV